MAKLLVALTLLSVGSLLQAEECAPVTNPGDPSHMYPDYNDALNHDYTLMLEMVDMIKKETYYIREIRHRTEYLGLATNEAVLVMQKNGTETIYYYYPDEFKFITFDGNKCKNATAEEAPLNYWGWWDTDPGRGQKLFGPGALLRWSYTYELEADDVEGPVPIGGILCNKWRACEGDGNVDLRFLFSVEQWSMPQMDRFTDAHGGFPVQIEQKLMDGSEHYVYNIESFVPYVTHHHYLDIPEGAECEPLINLFPGQEVPTIVDHFQTSQEVLINSFLNGYQNGTEIMDYTQFFYSRDMSLVRFDYVPLDESHVYGDELKIVHDFNTGVQYKIDKVQGTCSWDFIPVNGFDNHGFNHIGTGGSLLGPNELFHLDDTYAVAGPGRVRDQHGYWWTSTRSDMPDTTPGKFIDKAVLDYMFITTEEEDEDGHHKKVYTPLRQDLFVYDTDHPQKVVYQQTGNMFDFSEVKLYSEDEFKVDECYDYSDFEWSYIYITFKADHWQINAAADSPEVVKHQVYKHLIQMSSISPVRISALDISDGISGPGNNISVTDMMIVSVRLLDKAPDLFRFGKETSTPNPFPGSNEKKIEHVTSSHHCATLCTEAKDMDCVSFHHCDDNLCFLSKIDGQDGSVVPDIKNCELWELSLVNRTFSDTPSHLVDDDIMNHIDEFVLNIPFGGNKTTKIYATDAIHLLSPDPYNLVRMQFYFTRRDTTFTHPNTTIKNIKDITECETLCVTTRAYNCEGLAHDRINNLCLLSALHYEQMDYQNDIAAQTDVYIMSRSYIFDYSPIFGGVALNTTGDIVNDVMSFETCARMCSTREKTCNSFEYCAAERVCNMHTEHYLDVAGGDNVVHDSKCIHFSKRSVKDFKTYSNQGLPDKDHKLIAIDSDEASCAYECTHGVESATCESFDFVSECTEQDKPVCSEDLYGSRNLCYISTKHVGEKDVSLKNALHSIHYSREYFGDLDYDTWKNGKRSGNGGDGSGYNSGDMTGLAFGMIFLGVILSIGFLALLVHFKPNTVPQDFSISFKNTVNTSDI